MRQNSQSLVTFLNNNQIKPNPSSSKQLTEAQQLVASQTQTILPPEAMLTPPTPPPSH
jgi:hypothetical protein